MPDWDPWFNEGAGIALADISGTGRPDLIVFMIDGVPNAANAGYYRIGWDLDTAGQISSWSPWMTVPDWFTWANAGGDIAVADVDGDGQLAIPATVTSSSQPEGRLDSPMASTSTKTTAMSATVAGFRMGSGRGRAADAAPGAGPFRTKASTPLASTTATDTKATLSVIPVPAIREIDMAITGTDAIEIAVE